MDPIICFGQQPCGFFPKRFLAAKVATAKRLQAEIGGNIMFFCHDSDADYRETVTLMRDRQSGAEVRLNFLQDNKIQKKFSPLYAKRIPDGWKTEIVKQLPRFVERPLIDIFKSTEERTVADFCLAMYRKMGLLDRSIGLIRSGERAFRQAAKDVVGEYFADVKYQGEIVRAKIEAADPNTGILHEGGDNYIRFPLARPIEKWQKNPGRDQRFAWMQSVIHCTHYIYGEGEKNYLDTSAFPEVTFINRDKIDQPDFAWLESAL